MLPIQKLFASNERLFKLTTEGITHEESLKEMQNCNSANWVAGHIAYLRNNIMAHIGLPPVADETMKPLYNRGTKLEPSKAFPFDVLKKIYVDSHPLILEGVKNLKDEAVLEQVTFMGFHEAYHIGQISLLRKMLGKEGAIR